ncbi:MAG: hypothetical protein ACE5F1_08495 [Planctomycetota bacterium]
MDAWFDAELTPAERSALDGPLRGHPPEGIELAQARIIREVYQLALPGGRRGFVKVHLFPFPRLRLRYALRASPTQHERRMLEIARDRGILAPRPLAEATTRGILGPKQAILVTEALPDGLRPGPEQVIRAARELAERGLFYPDLHADNLRVLDGRIACLDFQSCRARRVESHELLYMIARSLMGSEERWGQAPESLLQHLPVELPRKRLLPLIAELERRQLASRRRHCLRSSTRVRMQRLPPFGKRLSLRRFDGGTPWPAEWNEEPLLPGSPGRCRLARSTNDRLLRVRRAGGLRRYWIAAHGAGNAAREEIVAWERIGPWPFAREYLYISDPMGALDVDALLRSLAGHNSPPDRARVSSHAS